MSFTEKRKNRCINSIRAIAKSSLVEKFKYGITYNPGQRSNTFRNCGFDCYAALEFDMTLEQVLDLEKAVYDECHKNKKDCLYTKDSRKDISYRRSSGAQQHDKYVFYITWWLK